MPTGVVHDSSSALILVLGPKLSSSPIFRLSSRCIIISAIASGPWAIYQPNSPSRTRCE